MTFLIYRGELVDQFSGVPQSQSKIEEFFKKAQSLGEGKDAAEPAPASSGDFIVDILNEGEGELIPKGARVTVHYTGKFLDGKVFDSSVKRGDPF